MLVNSSITVFHKGFDDSSRLETWTRYNYDKVWCFGGKGASVNKGYDNANDIEIRIPYNEYEDLEIGNFSIGDIVVQGTLDIDITTSEDLSDYETYVITNITNNTFGNNPHIHIGGR